MRARLIRALATLAALGAAALIGWAVTAGSGSADGRSTPHSRTLATLKRNARLANLVFVGRIARVGSRPPAWSGHYTATQRVRYTVIRRLKGRVGRTATVAHLVVFNSRNASERKPGLAGSVFRRKRALIVFVRRVKGHLRDFDEDLGTLRFTRQNLATVRRLVRKH